MGVIYAAHDPAIDRKVAIKLIRTDLQSGEDQADYVARFQREARAAGRCVHPNIVAIYDFAVHEGNPFLAMEYVEARNLSQVLQESGRFPQPQAIAIILQVLDALACAHDVGIVHRDVKPANILLSANCRVKMTDFGIARFDGADLTLDGAVIGTPSYMSPEQCRGEVVDARSDLFSTGVVFHEMLTGERPFSGRNFIEVASHLVNEPLPDIRAKFPAISQALAAIIERALAKQPADRFASAADMAVALRQAPLSIQPGDETVVRPRPPEHAPWVADATLATIAQKLAPHVGPMAQRLVQSAAQRSGSLDELCDTLSRLIDRPDQKVRFCQEVLAGQTQMRTSASGAVIASAEAARAEQELALHVGPIARILVKRALEQAKSAEELWQLLATHIAAEADRRAFLRRRG
jgi:serine/threonine protein kinase